MHPSSLSSAQCGVSLIEAAVVTAIVAVTAGSLLPDFGRLQQRQRLHGVAAQLETEMQYARSLAVTEGQAVRFSFRAEAGKSCYTIHTGAAGACQCSGETMACEADARGMRAAGFEDARGIRATSNTASFLFDPIKGTVTPTATVTVANPQGDTVRLVVNVMGRVRACTPSALPGYRAC